MITGELQPLPRKRGRPRKNITESEAAALAAASASRRKKRRLNEFDIKKKQRENHERKGIPVTIYGLYDQWLLEGEGRHSPDYARSMQTAVRGFVEITGITNLYDIERHHFVKLKNELLNVRKNTADSWNFYLRHWRVLLGVAKDLGFYLDNILDGLKTITRHDTKRKVISDTGIKSVLDYLDDPRNFEVSPSWFWRIVIKVFYYTGIRRRQLVGLTWGDINLRQMTITLKGEHSKNKREWIIPLSEALIEPLAELQKRTEMQLKRPINKNEQLFNVTHFSSRWRTNGSQAHEMTRDHVSSSFRRIKDKTGIEISPHRFRHTFASKMANADGGLDGIKELQRILGHTDIKITLSYVEADMSKMRNMVGNLGNI